MKDDNTARGGARRAVTWPLHQRTRRKRRTAQQTERATRTARREQHDHARQRRLNKEIAMDDEVKKLLKQQGEKVAKAAELAFDLLLGDHTKAARVIGEDVARRVGRPDIAREIAERTPATPRTGDAKKPPTTQPNPRPSNVIDGEFMEDDDHE